MRTPRIQRARLASRINSLVAPERPLREVVGNLSKVAKYAIDEANSLSVERVEITIARLPKKLDGFRVLHLSDTHHSQFTGLEHISRAVTVANQLNPYLVALTGDYDSHERQYIAPVAVFLASDLAADLTGQIVGVQGPKVFLYRMEQTDGVEREPTKGPFTPAELKEQWSKISGA